MKVKVAKNWREYCKIVRKYLKKRIRKYSHLKHSLGGYNLMYCFVELRLDNMAKLGWTLVRTKDHNLRNICAKTMTDFGKEISIIDRKGILKGVSITPEDYYYIIETDGNIWYHSCVGRYKLAY